MHARESRQIKKLSSYYRAEPNLDGLRICRGSIGQTESFSMDRESIEKLSRSYRDKVQKARWIKIVLTSIEKEDQRSSIDSLVVERYQEAVEIAQK